MPSSDKYLRTNSLTSDGISRVDSASNTSDELSNSKDLSKSWSGISISVKSTFEIKLDSLNTSDIGCTSGKSI